MTSGSGRYVAWAIGRAIASRAGRRSVVLIDEIDKADIDFPNDLLHELDQLASYPRGTPARLRGSGQQS